MLIKMITISGALPKHCKINFYLQLCQKNYICFYVNLKNPLLLLEIPSLVLYISLHKIAQQQKNIYGVLFT